MTQTTLETMIDGRKVHTIDPDESIRIACITMSSLDVGALPVVNPDGTLVGMLSERDVIKRSVIVYRPSETTAVRTVMTPNPKWLPPDAKPEEALQVMAKGGFRHVPICREGQVVGIVSLRDFTPKCSSLRDWPQGKSDTLGA